MVTTPMIVVLSAIIMKERMQKMVTGKFWLVERIFILYGRSIGTATNASLGNILVFVHAVSYGFYLITVKN
jgi:drug/metabolite transporter (DMT)-like permease